MNNFELEHIARRLNIPLNGIYNKDKILGTPIQDGGYIINIQDDYDTNGNDLGGTHWTAIFVDKHHAVYFDSFGMPPPVQIQHFLHRFVPFHYNAILIQNINSGVCGKYVLYFMYEMTRNKHIPLNKRFHNFLRMWSSNPEHNRTILLKKFPK